jgi:hypothetical protein
MKSTFLAINITTFYRMTINSKIINCLNFHRSFYLLFVSTSIFVKNCHFTRVPLNMKKLQKLSSNWCCWILRYTRSVEKTLFDVRFNWVISIYWYVLPKVEITVRYIWHNKCPQLFSLIFLISINIHRCACIKQDYRLFDL